MCNIIKNYFTYVGIFKGECTYLYVGIYNGYWIIDAT